MDTLNIFVVYKPDGVKKNDDEYDDGNNFVII